MSAIEFIREGNFIGSPPRSELQTAIYLLRTFLLLFNASMAFAAKYVLYQLHTYIHLSTCCQETISPERPVYFYRHLLSTLSIHRHNLAPNHHVPINRKRQPARRNHIQHIAIRRRPSKLCARRLRDLGRVDHPGDDPRAPVPTDLRDRIPRLRGEESVAMSIEGEIVVENPRGRGGDLLGWAGGGAVCVDADLGQYGLRRVGEIERLVAEEPDAVDAEFWHRRRRRHQRVADHDARGSRRDVDGPDDAEGRVRGEHGCGIEFDEAVEEDGILDFGGEAGFGCAGIPAEVHAIQTVRSRRRRYGLVGAISADDVVCLRVGLGDAGEPLAGGETVEEFGLGV